MRDAIERDEVDVIDHGPGSGGGPNTRETVRFLELPTARLCYRRAGRGPAVLWIQGAGTVGEAWRPQIDGLSDRVCSVWFDNRGMGDSQLHSGTLSIEGMAADALAIMDAEGIGRFHVVGHSMGGLIAQEVALLARHRVVSLSLLCTFAHGPQAARLTPSLIWTGLRTRIGTRAMRRRAFLELVMPTSSLAGKTTAELERFAAELRPLFGHDLADQPSVVMRQVGAMRRHDAAARLAALGGMPTLVVSAEHDRLALPRFGRELAALIPGARFIELSHAAHGVPIHDPGRINRLLAEHFIAAGGVGRGSRAGA